MFYGTKLYPFLGVPQEDQPGNYQCLLPDCRSWVSMSATRGRLSPVANWGNSLIACRRICENCQYRGNKKKLKLKQLQKTISGNSTTKFWQKYQPNLRKWTHILLTWVSYSESDVQVSDFSGSPNFLLAMKLLWCTYEENNIFFLDLSSTGGNLNSNTTPVHKIIHLINKIKS